VQSGVAIISSILQLHTYYIIEYIYNSTYQDTGEAQKRTGGFLKVTRPNQPKRSWYKLTDIVTTQRE